VTVNVILTVVFVAFLVALLVIEAYTAAKHIPTISERLQRLGRSVPLVTVIVCALIGMLLVHFFGQSGCVP
jgi:hypothetical protein